MEIENLEIYKISISIGDKVWDIVSSWKYFEKDTIGKQLTRSADSISANISEGFGRFHYKDSKLFLYYARGSLFETKTWLSKAENRNRITPIQYKELDNQMNTLGIKLNNFINSIGTTKPPK